MPQQNRKQKAAETGIIGLGIALISIGLESLNTNLELGVGVLVVGLVLVYVGVTYRNISTGLKPDEVVDAIDGGIDQVKNLLRE